MQVISIQELAEMKRQFLNRKILINLDQTKYKILDEVAQILQWKEAIPSESHIIWKDTYITDEEYRRLMPFQKINHFPGSYLLGKKNELCRNLNKMKKQFPDDYDFYPKTWQLPYQSEELRFRQGVYIVKPESNCQGRGIFITKKLEPYLDKHFVVQEYLTEPYLIDDLKFDLRIYVLLKSVQPLKIFMYREGLARFSTQKYVKPHKRNFSSFTMHLTNYAINKKSKDFIFNKEDQRDDIGHKRSLSSILKLLETRGHNVNQLMTEIQSVIIKTICSSLPDLIHLYKAGQHLQNETFEQCFELFGFDIILDHKLKPYLLEVNHTPSFSADTPLDRTIKKNLILDTLILMDIRNKPKELFAQNKRAPVFQRQNKLSQTEKEQQYAKMDKYEKSHVHGYWRIYPDDNSSNFEKFLPPKPKEKLITRSRLNTNQSFTEFENMASAQLTTSRNIPLPQQSRQTSIRPQSSTTQISRPQSGIRRQFQTPSIGHHSFPIKNQLIYPQQTEVAPKPPLKMVYILTKIKIPIKTFNFEKIDFNQRNE
ncbi:hypothetical protein pb186bvf_010508 [Paramecium bursaria]